MGWWCEWVTYQNSRVIYMCVTLHLNLQKLVQPGVVYAEYHTFEGQNLSNNIL